MVCATSMGHRWTCQSGLTSTTTTINRSRKQSSASSRFRTRSAWYLWQCPAVLGAVRRIARVLYAARRILVRRRLCIALHGVVLSAALGALYLRRPNVRMRRRSQAHPAFSVLHATRAGPAGSREGADLWRGGGGGAAAAHRPSVNALMSAVTTQPTQNKCTCAAAWCWPACKQWFTAHEWHQYDSRCCSSKTVKRREPVGAWVPKGVRRREGTRERQRRDRSTDQTAAPPCTSHRSALSST